MYSSALLRCKLASLTWANQHLSHTSLSASSFEAEHDILPQKCLRSGAEHTLKRADLERPLEDFRAFIVWTSKLKRV